MVSLKNLSVLFPLRRHLAVYHSVATLPILVDILDNVCSLALRNNLLYAKPKSLRQEFIEPTLKKLRFKGFWRTAQPSP